MCHSMLKNGRSDSEMKMPHSIHKLASGYTPADLIVRQIEEPPDAYNRLYADDNITKKKPVWA